jgi:hypothetical protein
MKGQMDAIEKGHRGDNPISTAVDLRALRESPKAENQTLATILAGVNDIKVSISKLESRKTNPLTLGLTTAGKRRFSSEFLAEKSEADFAKTLHSECQRCGTEIPEEEHTLRMLAFCAPCLMHVSRQHLLH